MNSIQRKKTKKHLLIKRLISEEIFAYPTESFYALGVDATNPKAIQELFRVKHREKGKPIALIATGLWQVKKFFFMTEAEERLAKKYWPGGLTILLRPKNTIAARALVGWTTPASGHPSLHKEGTNQGPRHTILIGVRVPAHAGARRLAKQTGTPITATSANISGQPPTKSASKVKRDFPGILVMPRRCGRQTKPSTVIEIVNNNIHIHRLGSTHV